MLEAFRKKYTSARKVVFKPATAVDPSLDHGNNKGPDSPCDVKDELEPAAANTTAASSSDGRICVQVEFAGPQPIKGPAEVLCSLLGGVSVTATPVFLARGRRRKRPKTCFVSDMSVEGTAVIAGEGRVGRSRGRVAASCETCVCNVCALRVSCAVCCGSHGVVAAE